MNHVLTCTCNNNINKCFTRARIDDILSLLQLCHVISEIQPPLHHKWERLEQSGSSTNIYQWQRHVTATNGSISIRFKIRHPSSIHSDENSLGASGVERAKGNKNWFDIQVLFWIYYVAAICGDIVYVVNISDINICTVPSAIPNASQTVRKGTSSNSLH